MNLETPRSISDALGVSVGHLLYQENKDELLLTLAKILDGQSPEFIEGILALTRACLENFGNKQINPRFSYLLPQECSQHIDELAVGRRFGKCSSRNVL